MRQFGKGTRLSGITGTFRANASTSDWLQVCRALRCACMHSLIKVPDSQFGMVCPPDQRTGFYKIRTVQNWVGSYTQIKEPAKCGILYLLISLAPNYFETLLLIHYKKKL